MFMQKHFRHITKFKDTKIFKNKHQYKKYTSREHLLHGISIIPNYFLSIAIFFVSLVKKSELYSKVVCIVVKKVKVKLIVLVAMFERTVE